MAYTASKYTARLNLRKPDLKKIHNHENTLSNIQFEIAYKVLVRQPPMQSVLYMQC